MSQKVREYDRIRKNYVKNVHLPENNNEAKCDVNCDVKLNCSGKNEKSNHNKNLM